MLITPEEKKRLEEISSVAHLRHGVKRADIVWVCELAERLACLKPTEEAFPRYAAVINHLACAAIPVGFVAPIPAEQEATILGTGFPKIHLMSFASGSNVCEATLLVRPYIRLVEPRTEEMLERIARHGRIRVDIDGDTFIQDGRAEEHLVGFDGYGLCRQPFYFRGGGSPDGKGSTFGVGELETATGQAIVTHRGIFLSGSVQVDVWLSNVPLEEHEMVRLSTGLVLGRYSTKEPGTPPAFGPTSQVKGAKEA